MAEIGLHAANKGACHPERSPVKDLHGFFGSRRWKESMQLVPRATQEKANAGPSLESVQDDSAIEGRIKQ
jgi:hypothetical protein